MKKRYVGMIKLLIGLAILFSLVYKVGVKEVYATILAFKFSYIPIALFFIASALFLDTINYNILFSPLKIHIKFKNLFRCQILGWAIGLLLPSRLGEFSIIYFLRKEGIELGKGSAVVIINKLISFIVASLFAIIGFFMFFDKIQSLKLAVIIALFFVVSLFAILSNKSRTLIRRFILRRYENKFSGFSSTFFHFIKKGKGALFLNLLNTTLKWILTVIVTYVLFLALNTHVDFIDVLLITSIISIISLIPVTISGLGIRESSAVFLFALRGIDSVIVTSVYIMLLVIKYSSSLIIINTMLKEKHLKLA